MSSAGTFSCKTRPCGFQAQGLTRQPSRAPQHLNDAEEFSRVKRGPAGVKPQGLTRRLSCVPQHLNDAEDLSRAKTRPQMLRAFFETLRRTVTNRIFGLGFIRT